MLTNLLDVQVRLIARVGTTHVSIAQVLEWQPGSVVTLTALSGAPIELLINGRPFAVGRVVEIDGVWALRITELLPTPTAEGPPV